MTIPTTGLFALLAPHKDIILAGAVSQAKMSGAQPTIDMVKTAGLDVARRMAADMIQGFCKSKLDVAVTMYGFTAGPRPADRAMDDPEYVAWRDQFDEHIMDTLGQDVLRAAGQDFIGEYLTDSEIDEEVVRDAAAAVMARSIVQSNVLERQPGQVLAEIGIVAEDLAMAAGTIVGVGAAIKEMAPEVSESTARGHVEQLVGKQAISLMAAGAFDLAAVTELLKGAFDDDPFLPLEYISRLGGTQADQPYFAAYFRAAGKDAVSNTAQAAMMAALTGAIVEMPKDAPKPKKPGKGKKSDAAAAAPAVSPPPPPVVASGLVTTEPKAAGDDDITDVIKLMLLHGGDSQEEVGNLVGKSRAHVNNAKAGKAKVTVTALQRKNLITRLQLHIDGLQQAIARLG